MPKELVTMDDFFNEYLPDNLYRSHYELTELFGFSPQEWRKYLRDNAMFIDMELAAIAEAEARSALSRLATASSAEVSGLKAVLEKSQLINNAQKQATKVVLTHIPRTEDKK